MRKILVIVLAVILFALCPVKAGVTYADSLKTENDINLTDWSVNAGESPVIATGEDGVSNGIYLYGKGSGEIFSYTYAKELSSVGIMMDFVIDTENI